MPRGTVKWFNNAKGYGFILPADSEEDIFAHYSAISMDGYRTLKAGQEVSFDLVDGEKGKHAANITLCDSEKSHSAPTSQTENTTNSEITEQIDETLAVAETLEDLSVPSGD